MASSNLEEQIAELRAKFSNNKLKIIENQGDYKLVIRLEMCDGEVFIRLYVPNTPETPYVLISVKHDENDEISAQLQKILNSKITNLKKSEDLNLLEFFTTAEEFLQNSNIGASTSKNSEDENSKTKSPKNRKRDKNGKEKETTKFSGMKPVSDVINRIMWDEKIPSEKFLVGYLDRFVGVQEVPMKDFEGKDFATADPEEFALPEHRIQYFKYKSEKVWDKKNKIDFIFGSTGATKSIFDVMKEEDERNP